MNIKTLESIQDRILWLSIQLVNHANTVRTNRSDLKVGGHQTSSSSVVTILTYLYFEYLEKYDYVSVKPHASPVFHAIQYLLGNLDKKYLTSLRELHGLQSYPSRTKDPDLVDFSGGSVGIGSIAPNFAAISHKYLKDHSLLNKDLNNARFISLLGDAELDEGTIWEAIADPTMEDISNVIWIVDLNRQSLDRIIPFIRVKTWRQMFEANGWNVIDAKYGKKLEDVFNLPNGELMKDAIDDMPNELYQRLLRKSEALREWLPKSVKDSLSMEKLISDFDEEQLYDIFSNLGGHDFYCIDKAFKHASKSKKPTVIFAYTLKGWNLPSVGDPQNHSVILNDSQINELSSNLNIDNKNIWAKFNEGSPEDNKCIEIQNKLKRDIPENKFQIDFPKSFKNDYKNMMSSQQIFGLLMTENSRLDENIRNKFVSISPDVASSTNLGGWINKMGIWQSHKESELPEEDLVRALNWEMSKSGQHIELGISENNLFMALGQLGLTEELFGSTLIPIGTLYDPFVRRGLDALFFGVYSGAKFIMIGTPSGISLSPEGGLHQSLITPSIGMEMPELDYYEPAFGKELEWIFLNGMNNVSNRISSLYLRLTTSRLNQDLFSEYNNNKDMELLREDVINGAYLFNSNISNDSTEYKVNLFSMGAMFSEVVEAQKELLKEGISSNLINITGPGPLYRNFHNNNLNGSHLLKILGNHTNLPSLSIIDGHPHALSWIGSALGVKSISLGITEFGQSGDQKDLYEYYGLDKNSIQEAVYKILDL